MAPGCPVLSCLWTARGGDVANVGPGTTATAPGPPRVAHVLPAARRAPSGRRRGGCRRLPGRTQALGHGLQWPLPPPWVPRNAASAAAAGALAASLGRGGAAAQPTALSIGRRRAVLAWCGEGSTLVPGAAFGPMPASAAGGVGLWTVGARGRQWRVPCSPAAHLALQVGRLSMDDDRAGRGPRLGPWSSLPSISCMRRARRRPRCLLGG